MNNRLTDDWIRMRMRMRTGLPFGSYSQVTRSVSQCTNRRPTWVSSKLFCIPNDFGAAAELSSFICSFLFGQISLSAARDLFPAWWVCVCDYHLLFSGHGDKTLLASQRERESTLTWRCRSFPADSRRPHAINFPAFLPVRRLILPSACGLVTLPLQTPFVYLASFSAV